MYAPTLCKLLKQLVFFPESVLGTELASRRPMSYARAIHPGTTYFVTRRTERRHCLLRPDPRVNQLVRYALVVSALRHGVLLHAFCAMSTHVHYVITGTRGNLPKFLEMFHGLVSRGIKRIHAWDGAVWDRAQTSVVELCTRQAIIEKIAYTLVNPVQAGLVWMAREWPGVKTAIKAIGRHSIEARRPQTYFSAQNDKWVPSAKLNIALPPSVSVDDARGFRRAIGRELSRLENAAHAVIPKQRVLGAKRAMLIAPETRITSYEPKYQRNPTFAVGREAPQGAGLAAVAKRRAFRVAYRTALLAWRAGNRTVEFPAGTYAMREFHGANIAYE